MADIKNTRIHITKHKGSKFEKRTTISMDGELAQLLLEHLGGKYEVNDKYELKLSDNTLSSWAVAQIEHGDLNTRSVQRKAMQLICRPALLEAMRKKQPKIDISKKSQKIQE